MSLQITLKGQSEAIVRAQLEQGHVRSPEELIERALEAYSASTVVGLGVGTSKKAPAEAAEDIFALRKNVTLGGLKIKDLSHEGHKY